MYLIIMNFEVFFFFSFLVLSLQELVLHGGHIHEIFIFAYCLYELGHGGSFIIMDLICIV